jgi:hypothetical protein
METMVIHQQRTGYADMLKSFGAQDEQPESELPDAMEKFMQGCHLRAVGISPEGLEKETAGIERRADEIIAKTRGSFTAKIAPAKNLAARTERTVFPNSGKVIVAELDERGAVIRTYEEK